MDEQRERSRGSRAGRFAPLPGVGGFGSEFIGYPNETEADGASVLAVARGEASAQVVLDRTPFYAEGGGQIGDRGELAGDGAACSSMTRSAWGTRSCTSVGSRGSWRSARRSPPASTPIDAGARRATTRPPICCTGPCATCWASRQSRPAAGSVPMGCDSTFPASAATPRASLREVERIVNAQMRRNAGGDSRPR